MKKRLAYWGAAAALLLAARVTWAEPAQQRAEELARAARRLRVAELNTGGAATMRMTRERKRIEKMIEDLQAGRAVDPAEIDRALERAERGVW